MNRGFSSTMTQAFGEMLTSQAEKANRAFLVCSGSTPAGRCTRMSTCWAVLSSMRAILIFPFSAAETMVSIRISVVTPNGISVMRRSFFDSVRMRARMRTRPVPRSPSR